MFGGKAVKKLVGTGGEAGGGKAGKRAAEKAGSGKPGKKNRFETRPSCCAPPRRSTMSAEQLAFFANACSRRKRNCWEKADLTSEHLR